MQHSSCSNTPPYTSVCVISRSPASSSAWAGGFVVTRSSASSSACAASASLIVVFHRPCSFQHSGGPQARLRYSSWRQTAERKRRQEFKRQKIHSCESHQVACNRQGHTTTLQCHKSLLTAPDPSYLTEAHSSHPISRKLAFLQPPSYSTEAHSPILLAEAGLFTARPFSWVVGCGKHQQYHLTEWYTPVALSLL